MLKEKKIINRNQSKCYFTTRRKRAKRKRTRGGKSKKKTRGGKEQEQVVGGNRNKRGGENRNKRGGKNRNKRGGKEQKGGKNSYTTSKITVKFYIAIMIIPE